MSNKTAMQQLIEWGDEMMLKHPLKVLSFAEAIDKAVELLEKEKEQIMEAHYAPKYGCFSEDYYNETYKGGNNE